MVTHIVNLGSRLLKDPNDKRLAELQETCPIALIGVPWDWSTGGDPGARHAPKPIINTMLSRPIHGPFTGDITCKPSIIGEIDIAGGDWETTRNRISKAADDLFSKHRFTLFVGGDHSITGPILRTLLNRGSVGLVMLDAHYDLRSVKEGVTSGSWLWETASWAREHIGPTLDAVIIGIADYANPPYLKERAERLGFRIITAGEAVTKPVTNILEQIDVLAERDYDYYYITVDIDHISQSHAPGVNSPTPLGMDPWLTLQILTYSINKLNPIGADIVEVVPVKDLSSKTVRLAAVLGLAMLAGAARYAREG